MATIKDIAKLAGVSHGTVSNVLNKKGNVSSEKIEKVESIAKQLGYTLNEQASTLRRGQSNIISVLIPYYSRKKYSDFYAGITLGIEKKGYVSNLIYVKNRNNLTEILNNETANFSLALILVGLNPKKNELKSIENKTNIFVYNDRLDFNLKNCRQWFYNPEKVVTDISKKIKTYQTKRIILLSTTIEESSYLVEEMMKNFEKEYPLIVYKLDRENNLNIFFRLINSLQKGDTIVSTNVYDTFKLIDSAHWLNLKTYPNIISFSDKKLIHSYDIDYYEFDYKNDGYHLVDRIINNPDDSERITELTSSNLVRFSKKSHSSKSLNFVTIPSPMSTALKLILPRFKSETGIDVNITEYSYEELWTLVNENDKRLKNIDIMRVDMAWLSTIKNTFFEELTNNEIIKYINKNLKRLPSEYSNIKQKQFTVPLDPSVQILIYRKDLFDNQLIQRQYYEKFKKELIVPTNFEEFNEVSQFFSKQNNSTSPTEFGHTMSLRDRKIVASDILPRINEHITINGGNAKNLDNILSDVLKKYYLSSEHSYVNSNYFWTDIVNNLLSGTTAMEIVYSNYISDILTSSKRITASKVGFAPSPSNQSLLGGGSLGIISTSKKKEAALSFIEWMFNENNSRIITSLGGIIYNKNIINDSSVIELYPWLEDSSEYFAFSNRLKISSNTITYEQERQLGERTRQYMISKLSED